jgi:hypothetical protein
MLLFQLSRLYRYNYRLAVISHGSQIAILYLCFNIDATNWTMLAGNQPLINTIAMEKMHTRETSEN